MHGGLAAGLIRLERGVMVSGAVYDSSHGDLLDGVNVEAGDLSMHAQGRTCGGVYSMVIPEGTHAIYSGGYFWDGAMAAVMPNASQLASFIAGDPVEVTVTASDVLSETMVVTAPDMYVTDITNGGVLSVTVENDGSTWTASGGELVCTAYVPGTLSGAFDPNATVQNPVSSVVLSQTLGAANPMAPFPLGESFDLYLTWVQPDPYGGETTTVLDSAFNVPITATSVITFTLPAAVNNMAYGEVVEGYTGYSGALVYVTNESGDIVGWTTSGMSGYLLYNLPAGSNYTVTAYSPDDGSSISTSEHTATADNDDYFGFLELAKTATPALTLIETHRVNADSSVFDGIRAVGGDYQYQIKNSLWLDAPYGVLMTVGEIQASLQPGRSTENVMATVNEFSDGYWMTHDSIPESNEGVCGPECLQVCSDPIYNWGGEYALYFSSGMTDGLELSMVDSAPSTWADSLVVTRTMSVVTGQTFAQEVTVSVQVTEGTPGDVYTGTLQFRIYGYGNDLDSQNGVSLGFADVRSQTPGVDENGLDVDDGYNYAWGYAYYNIENPIIGHEYSYTKIVDVAADENLAHDIFFRPRTRVGLTEYRGLPNYSVEQDGIYIGESGSLGDLHLASSTTPMEFLPGYLHKLYRREVQHNMEIGEVDALRPQVTATYPANGAMDIATGAVITMTMDKPGPWGGGYFLNMIDQWGNLVADTEIGPYPYGVFFEDGFYNNDTLTYTPDESLTPGTAYCVTANLRDFTYYHTPTTTGKDLIRFWFATEPLAGDVTPPEVVSTIPYNNETGVPTVISSTVGSYKISATFSEAIQYMGTEATSMFKLDAQGGDNVLPSIPIDSQWMGNRFAVYPRAALEPNTWYRVMLFPAGIQDLSDNAMESIYQWEFYTGDDDSQGPTLSMPLDGATDVSVNTPSIVLYADEELDASTLILGETLHLYAGGEDVSGAFEVQYLKPQQGVQFFLKPENQFTALPNDTVMTLTVDTELPSAVTDMAGNVPAGGVSSQSFSWRTVPTFGNAMPSFYNLISRIGPQYPEVYNTAAGYFVNASANIGDDGYDFLGEAATARMPVPWIPCTDGS